MIHSTAIASVAQCLNVSIIALSVFWLFLVVNGIVQSAIAAWKDVRKPQQVAAAPSFHYACPLTCELPSSPVASIPTPTQLEVTTPAPLAPEPVAKAVKVTYSHQVKERCSRVFGYQVTTKADVKRALINKGNLNFMAAVNLERTGKDFYEAVDACLDRIEEERAIRRAAS
jgi:hypothetical protein